MCVCQDNFAIFFSLEKHVYLCPTNTSTYRLNSSFILLSWLGGERERRGKKKKRVLSSFINKIVRVFPKIRKALFLLDLLATFNWIATIGTTYCIRSSDLSIYSVLFLSKLIIVFGISICFIFVFR